ncbi:MAG: hypothetical protein AAF598_08980 [Bacteroidota bacterium]
MTKQLIFLFACTIVLFTACKKEESVQELRDTTTSEDLLRTEAFLDEVEYQVDLKIEEKALPETAGKYDQSKNNDCITVAFVNPPGTFPNTITVTFDADGCTLPSGNTLAGTVTVVYTGQQGIPGFSRSATLSNFTFNGRGLEGTKTWTFNGMDENGNRSYTRTVQGAQITYLNGDVATWDTQRTWIQLDGAETETFIDDIVAVTGGSAGVNRFGVSYSTLILDPIIKERNCPWNISGRKRITRNNLIRFIDFGNGICDPLATVGDGNGNFIEITLNP